MNVEIPKIAENVETAEVVQVLVAVGDHVEADQPVLELEGDKASFEMPSPAAGEVVEIRVDEGDEVTVGEVVMTLRTASEGQDQDEDDQERPQGDEEPPQEDEEPPQEDQEGEQPGEEDPTPSTDGKASSTAPATGTSKGDGRGTAKSNGERRDTNVVRASPAARRKARELNVDLSLLAEELRGRRITPAEVARRARTKNKALEASQGDGEDFARFGEIVEEKLSRRRRVLASRMAEAWRTIPHVTQHDDLDVSELEEARRRWSERRRGDAPKLTITPLVVKACALALRAHPRLNASLSDDGTKLILKRYVNVAVAVDTEGGLVAPVVRDADTRPLGEIVQSIDELAHSVRAGRITHEELAGGTFTVTNLGAFGGTYFTPIIYPPQVAILGLCRTARRDGRLLLPISLSYDHRVVDGADAMRFLHTLGELLRDPLAMLMQA